MLFNIPEDRARICIASCMAYIPKTERNHKSEVIVQATCRTSLNPNTQPRNVNVSLPGNRLSHLFAWLRRVFVLQNSTVAALQVHRTAVCEAFVRSVDPSSDRVVKRVKVLDDEYDVRKCSAEGGIFARCQNTKHRSVFTQFYETKVE